jgi:MFS family permease
MLAIYTVIGIANAASSIVPGSLIISRWFDERRGTAMGTVFSGFAVGEMIGNLLAGNVVARDGWRAGYVSLAIVTLAVLGAGGIVDDKQRPRKPGPGNIANRTRAGDQTPRVLRRGFCDDRRYVLCIRGSNERSDHPRRALPNRLGISPRSGGEAVGHNVGSVVFRARFNRAAGGRIGARIAMVVSFAAIALTILLLLYAAHVWVLVGFMAGLALLGFGPPLITPVLQSQVLGLERFGLLNGIINSIGSVGYAVGPIVAGRAFDLTGSYATAIKVAAATALLGIVLTMLIRSPRALQPALA